MTRPVRPSERRLALAIGDALAVTLGVLVALWTWSITAGFPFNAAFVRGHAIWLLAVPLWLVLLIPTRDARVALDLGRTGTGVARAAAGLLVVYLAVFFFAGGEELPRLVALYVLWDATLLVFGWRVAAHWSFTRARFARRLLLVGPAQMVPIACAVLEDVSLRDAEVVGLVSADAGSGVEGIPTLGVPGDLDRIAQRLSITDIVVASETNPGDVNESWVQCLLRCQESGANVIRLAQLYEDTLQRVPVAHVEPGWLLTDFFDVARFRDVSPLAKRALDVAVGSLLAVVGLLLAPFVAGAILFETGRPVLYRQERLGRAGRSFSIAKFRTMAQGAEGDGQAQWSAPGDPRVTRVGRVLRRTRLDELANVLSVLRGEMSLVGPRPERPEFVEQLERDVPLYRARLIVPPGLTGWAQVSRPYGDSVEDAQVKLEYDLYYIKHQSVWFDALILVRTVGTMLRLGGR